MREDELYSKGVFASELDEDLGIEEDDEDKDDIDEEDLYDDDLDYPEDDEDGNYNPMEDYKKDGWE